MEPKNDMEFYFDHQFATIWPRYNRKMVFRVCIAEIGEKEEFPPIHFHTYVCAFEPSCKRK